MSRHIWKMKALLKPLSSRLRRESFLPTSLSIIINPYFIIRRGLSRSIQELAPAIKGTVLDFGCGSKPYESTFTGAREYWGVDVVTGPHNHRNSRIDVIYDGSRLPFKESRFDAAVSFEVLEHVPESNRMFSELLRVLKPGGLLLLSVPFAWNEHETPYDFRRYTSFGIQRELEVQGFSVLSVRKTTSFILTVSQLFIAYVVQHVLPRRPLLREISQLVFVFPLNVVSLLLDLLFPRRWDYFCNTVVLAQKTPVEATKEKSDT